MNEYWKHTLAEAIYRTKDMPECVHAVISSAVDPLTDAERLELRNYIEATYPGCPYPRNLSYNYATQAWIK